MDEDFTQDLIDLKDIEDIGYKFETPLASGTHFYWKVRGTNEGAPGEWSETGNFTTMAMPTAVTLVKPTNGEQDVSIRPTFEWTESQNVIYYHLQVASDDQFTNIAYESDEISIPSRRVFAGLTYATKYYWHVRATNDGAASEWSPMWEFTTVENTDITENETVADDFILYDNFPNPFSHITTIKFYIPRIENVRLALFDYLGNELITLVNKELTPGEYSYVLDSGKLPNGTYMYKLSAGSFSASKKMVLIR
jgi:hypothetical protein